MAALVFVAMLWKEGQLKIECQEIADMTRSVSSCTSFNHGSVAKCNV